MKRLSGFNSNNESQARGMYEEAVRRYGGMSEDALVGKLIDMVREQKSSGTFDEVQLLSFVNAVTPHLSEAQRKRLESLLGMISE